MGQKVNPKLYKFGITNFWDNINYPNNNKLVNFINYNYLFNLLSFFFNKYNIQIYFFKAKLRKTLALSIYIYNSMYTQVKSFKKKVKKVKLNYLKNHINAF